MPCAISRRGRMGCHVQQQHGQAWGVCPREERDKGEEGLREREREREGRKQRERLPAVFFFSVQQRGESNDQVRDGGPVTFSNPGARYTFASPSPHCNHTSVLFPTRHRGGTDICACLPVRLPPRHQHLTPWMELVMDNADAHDCCWMWSDWSFWKAAMPSSCGEGQG